MELLTKLNKHIANTNEEFKNASKARKRVMVAQDTIKRLEFNQLDIENGNTCNTFETGSIKDKLASDLGISCSVCAKGALFMNYVGRVNQFNFDEVHDNSEMDSPEMQKLLHIFSEKQLNLIETAFEGCLICKLENRSNNTASYYNQIELALNFHFTKLLYYEKNIDISINSESFPSYLLNIICENIIKNKGTFKLS